MKHCTSMLLALLLLASLTSCGETAETKSADTKAAAETTIETEPAETMPTDKVPALDFGGVDFRSANQGTGNTNGIDVYVAELTGDAVNDVIYNRNKEVEERFNIVVAEPLFGDSNAVSQAVKNVVTAGEYAYDVVVNQMETTGADVLQGLYMDLNTIPHLDFSAPWYPAAIKDNASVNGRMYMMVSDISLSYTQQTWAMTYNKTLAEQNAFPDLYAMVREGTWTLDTLISLTESLYQDANGNGERDNDGDIYGFTAGNASDAGCMMAAFLYASDQRTAGVEDGQMTFFLESEKANNIAVKLQGLLFSNEGTTKLADSKRATRNAYFMEEKAVIVPVQVCDFYNSFRDFEGSYGVLPLPKYEETQSRYYTVSDAGCNSITVPLTAGNTEMSGAVLEAMSAYSYNYVTPTYIGIALEAKGTRDEESIEMMQIVLDSRVMDFAYLYDGWNGWTFKLPQLISKADQYYSTYTSVRKSVENHYNKVLAYFMQ